MRFTTIPCKIVGSSPCPTLHAHAKTHFGTTLEVRFFSMSGCFFACWQEGVIRKHTEDQQLIESAKKGCRWQESVETDLTRIETHVVESTERIKQHNCTCRPMREDSEFIINYDIEHYGEHREAETPIPNSNDSDIFRHSVLLQGSVVAETERLAALRILSPNRSAEPVVENVTVPLRPPSCDEYERSSSGDALVHRFAGDIISHLRIFVQPEHSMLDLGHSPVAEVENDVFHPTSQGYIRHDVL